MTTKEIQFDGGQILFDKPRQVEDVKVFLSTLDLSKVVIIEYKSIVNSFTLHPIEYNRENWSGQWLTSTKQKVVVSKDNIGFYTEKNDIRYYYNKEGHCEASLIGRLEIRRRGEEKW